MKASNFILLVFAVMAVSCSKRIIKIDLIEPVKPPVVVDTLAVLQDTAIIQKVPVKISNPKKLKMVAYFPFDSYFLSEDESARIIDYIKGVRSGKVLIIGYTCTTGTETHNLELGYNRAESVKRLILEESPRIEVRLDSYGEHCPVSENLPLNRRCEVSEL
jgi:outer membrane protein OmpA-like peptidoglycan-associated protein